MLNVKQALWLFFTLIVLAGFGWNYSHTKTIFQLDDETLSTTVDSTAIKLLVRQFNAKGQLVNLLSSPLMQHIPKNDINRLSSPHIIVTDKDEQPWDISSLTATTYEGAARIVFKHQVIVHQNKGPKTQESTLKTEEITYYPKEKRASTTHWVSFEQLGNYVQSRGMNAYLDEKKVELLHHARGRYAPAKA